MQIRLKMGAGQAWRQSGRAFLWGEREGEGANIIAIMLLQRKTLRFGLLAGWRKNKEDILPTT